MSYNSIISKIPKEWKQKIEEIGNRPENRSSDEIEIKDDNKLVPLGNVTVTTIYNELIRLQSLQINILKIMERTLSLLRKYNWNDTFMLSVKMLIQ